MSSTAARHLIENLKGVRILTLHDFDKAGFSIVGTLRRDTWRYEFGEKPEVVDLGLRLEDVEAEGLEAERVYYREIDPSEKLRENAPPRRKSSSWWKASSAWS